MKIIFIIRGYKNVNEFRTFSVFEFELLSLASFPLSTNCMLSDKSNIFWLFVVRYPRNRFQRRNEIYSETIPCTILHYLYHYHIRHERNRCFVRLKAQRIFLKTTHRFRNVLTTNFAKSSLLQSHAIACEPIRVFSVSEKFQQIKTRQDVTNCACRNINRVWEEGTIPKSYIYINNLHFLI